MTKQDLQELKDRVKYALVHGFGIAKAEEYAIKLADGGGNVPPPDGSEALSPTHLLAMIESVEGAHQSPMKKVVSAKPSKAPSAATKAAEPEKKAEPAMVKSEKSEPAKIEAKAYVMADATVETRDSSDFSALIEELPQKEAKKP